MCLYNAIGFCTCNIRDDLFIIIFVRKDTFGVIVIWFVVRGDSRRIRKGVWGCMACWKIITPILIREAQVNSEISALYALQSTYTARVQLYFRQPLLSFLHAPYRTRQRWLIITKLATAQQIQPSHGQTQLTSYAFTLHTDVASERPAIPQASNTLHTQTRLTTFFAQSLR